MINFPTNSPEKSNLSFAWTNELNDLLNKFDSNTLDKPTNLPHNKIMSQTIKFYTAVLVTVRDLAKYKSKFSVHDVTTKLRESVNNGEILFSDRTTEDVDGTTTYRVEHEDVKSIFQDIFETQVIELTRTNNGNYYEYSVKLAKVSDVKACQCSPAKDAGVSLSQVMTQLAATVIKQAYQVTAQVVDEALVDYLIGRGTGSVVTMKQVQSRFDNVRGVSCADYAVKVEAHGFKVDKSNQYPSNWSTTIR